MTIKQIVDDVCRESKFPEKLYFCTRPCVAWLAGNTNRSIIQMVHFYRRNNVMVNVAPQFSSLVTSTKPPCASTMPLTTDSPSPCPGTSLPLSPLNSRYSWGRWNRTSWLSVTSRDNQRSLCPSYDRGLSKKAIAFLVPVTMPGASMGITEISSQPSSPSFVSSVLEPSFKS